MIFVGDNNGRGGLHRAGAGAGAFGGPDIDRCEHRVWCGGCGEGLVDVGGQSGTLRWLMVTWVNNGESRTESWVVLWGVLEVKQKPAPRTGGGMKKTYRFLIRQNSN